MDDQQLTLWEIVEAPEERPLDCSEAQEQALQEAVTAREALHSSKSEEWYTPALYIEAVRRVLGGIDIDPASCELANRTVKATRFFSQEENGLSHDWPGRVFLNPPYGKAGGLSNQQIWSHKLIEQYQAGITTEAILLVNAATGEKWFDPLWSFSLCFSRRIKFYTAEGKPEQPTHGNVFIYMGPNVDRFISVFSEIGPVIPAGLVIRRSA